MRSRGFKREAVSTRRRLHSDPFCSMSPLMRASVAIAWRCGPGGLCVCTIYLSSSLISKHQTSAGKDRRSLLMSADRVMIVVQTVLCRLRARQLPAGLVYCTHRKGSPKPSSGIPLPIIRAYNKNDVKSVGGRRMSRQHGRYCRVYIKVGAPCAWSVRHREYRATGMGIVYSRLP